MYWIKLTNKMFAGVPSRDAFIEKCVDIYLKRKHLPLFHELVHGTYPRLYLDVEIEYAEQQSADTMNEVLRQVWGRTVGAIAKLAGISEEQALNLKSTEMVNH